MACFSHFLIQECSQHFYEALLQRGYRRFGNWFFAPNCKECSACKTIRQRVSDFQPSKSQKRVLSKNSQTRVRISKPSLTQEKLELFDRYHFFMREKKGWKYHRSDEQYYYNTFIEGSLDFGYEINYFHEDKLVAVGFVDILSRSMSAIYCFYDHNFSHLSLGVFNILTQLNLAKSYGIVYFYPGYWIENHPSLGYKSKFLPFEVLKDHVGLPQNPQYKIYSA